MAATTRTPHTDEEVGVGYTVPRPAFAAENVVEKMEAEDGARWPADDDMLAATAGRLCVAAARGAESSIAIEGGFEISTMSELSLAKSRRKRTGKF